MLSAGRFALSKRQGERRIDDLALPLPENKQAVLATEHTEAEGDAMSHNSDTDAGDRIYADLSHVLDWFQRRVEAHLVGVGTMRPVKTEPEVHRMLEAYLGFVFHGILGFSGCAPCNTSRATGDQITEAIRNVEETLRGWGLEQSAIDLQTGNSIKRLNAQLKEQLFAGTPESSNANWTGCQLWLDRGQGGRSRLLFLDGAQWKDSTESSALMRSRRVYHWPYTFSRSIFQFFSPSEASGISCTALCYFQTDDEKTAFKTGFKEGAYFTLPAPRSAACGGCGLRKLVWLPDGSKVQFAACDSSAENSPGSRDEPVGIGWGKSSAIDPTCWVHDAEDAAAAVLGELPKPQHQEAVYWMFQSVMLYDWKFWYFFPVSNYRGKAGGLVVSTAVPLTATTLAHLDTISRRLITTFGAAEQRALTLVRKANISVIEQLGAAIDGTWKDLLAKKIRWPSAVSKAGSPATSDRRPMENEYKRLFENLLLLLLPSASPRFEDCIGVDEAWWTEKASTFGELRNRSQGTAAVGKLCYVVVNYWGAIGGRRAFGEWLSASTDPVAWATGWKQYLAIDEQARSRDYYTANDFLRTRATRKVILGWRAGDGQVVDHGSESPGDWVRHPPQLTREVAAALLSTGAVAANTGKADRMIARAEEQCSKYGSRITAEIERLNHYREDLNSNEPLGLYPGDQAVLGQVLEELKSNSKALGTRSAGSIDDHDPQGDAVASYLARLAVYLNVRMEIAPSSPHFLNFARCAFMAIALAEYFGPVPEGEDARTTIGHDVRWFYSIPVHVPGRASGDYDGATSILSVGSREALRADELSAWERLARRLVVPALVQEAVEEVALRTRDHEVARGQFATLERLSGIDKKIDDARTALGVVYDQISDIHSYVSPTGAEFLKLRADPKVGAMFVFGRPLTLPDGRVLEAIHDESNMDAPVWRHYLDYVQSLQRVHEPLLAQVLSSWQTDSDPIAVDAESPAPQRSFRLLKHLIHEPHEVEPRDLEMRGLLRPVQVVGACVAACAKAARVVMVSGNGADEEVSTFAQLSYPSLEWLNSPKEAKDYGKSVAAGPVVVLPEGVLPAAVMMAVVRLLGEVLNGSAGSDKVKITRTPNAKTGKSDAVHVLVTNDNLELRIMCDGHFKDAKVLVPSGTDTHGLANVLWTLTKACDTIPCVRTFGAFGSWEQELAAESSNLLIASVCDIEWLTVWRIRFPLCKSSSL